MAFSGILSHNELCHYTILKLFGLSFFQPYRLSDTLVNWLSANCKFPISLLYLSIFQWYFESHGFSVGKYFFRIHNLLTYSRAVHLETLYALFRRIDPCALSLRKGKGISGHARLLCAIFK